ncbi:MULTISPECIES: flagellar biosynthetic protein FliQ [Ponticaulis]|uniref:flagellar biosynthetic protein FliQ n=1 Tax=Ponticaulis TaxID=1123044 RepID=UPI0003B5D72C|nr:MULTISPECIES: flagellar biosynthetic protein FliQ [Ponticaulis]MAJ07453.1 flagellar type III secretion system protein FliQ [Ponticaulis sp.]RPG17688.1 MAG: flagellar biosynthetic protein FliQ [Hyphomonadaceae bacterium TMED125]|tara:strand:+ start:221 stop:487 length:267 start_codon:yes stop_codon:yes gene_type:complete
MTSDQALYFLTEMLAAALFVAGPILLATLLVGLIVSVIQVTTQIQEITLSYVPKILATGILLVVLGPWMLSKLTSFAILLYQRLPELG